MMKYKIRNMRLMLCLCLMAIGMAVRAQVTVNAPQQVVKGEQFRLQYVIDGNDYQSIKLGATDGFDVLHGPSVSTRSSFQMINGKTSQSSSVTLTYILAAHSEGQHTIGAATVVVGGQTITTNTARIEVLPPDSRASSSSQSAGSSASQQQRGRQSSGRQSGLDIASDELFMTVTASKKRVYEQEAVLLTYKLYTLVNVSSLTGELPELNRCHVQELNQSQQRSLSLEHYNGRNYRTCTWSQYLLFPQQAGKINIPAVNFEAIAYRSVQSMDPFDMFFTGGSIQREVKKTITAPAVEITVDPLPTPRPDNFCGAVGQFTMTSTLSSNELKANEALTMQVVVSGKGNMKLMQAPVVAFPNDFESYDVKVTDNIRTNTQGLSGSRTYDYIAVPRFGGEYEIRPVEFCYFDPSAKQYKTLTSDPYSVNVQRSEQQRTRIETASVQQEDVEVLASDIRFIKRGPTNVARADGQVFTSLYYWLAYLVLTSMLVIAMVIARRRMAASADVMGSRRRKAGKMVSRRLRAARKMLQAHNKEGFYDEMLKAMWGFAADKLSIDVLQLNRDNVAERMAQNGVAQEAIDDFISVIDDCEYARYAPGDPAANMDKVYHRAEDVIGGIK